MALGAALFLAGFRRAAGFDAPALRAGASLRERLAVWREALLRVVVARRLRVVGFAFFPRARVLFFRLADFVAVERERLEAPAPARPLDVAVFRRGLEVRVVFRRLAV